ncbi:MAG: choice-of-anchor V domain-containing protein [Bacteroidia bacterium]
MNKRFILLLSAAILCTWVIFSAFTHGTRKSGGGPPYNTNAPGDQTCSGVEGTNACHSGGIPDNSGTANTFITFSGGTSYVPGQTYTVTVQVTHPTRIRFGFQIVSILNSTLTNAGTVTLLDTTRTRAQIPNWGSYQDRKYVMHIAAGTYSNTSNPNQNAWSYKWKAPSSNVGKITFYACFLASNNNGTNDPGDETYYNSLVIDYSPTGIPALNNAATSVKIYPNPSTNELTADTQQDDLPVESLGVMNLQGRMLLEQRNASASSQMNIHLGYLPGGEYILQIRTRDGIIARKFSKL